MYQESISNRRKNGTLCAFLLDSCNKCSRNSWARQLLIVWWVPVSVWLRCIIAKTMVNGEGSMAISIETNQNKQVCMVCIECIYRYMELAKCCIYVILLVNGTLLHDWTFLMNMVVVMAMILGGSRVSTMVASNMHATRQACTNWDKPRSDRFWPVCSPERTCLRHVCIPSMGLEQCTSTVEASTGNVAEVHHVSP